MNQFRDYNHVVFKKTWYVPHEIQWFFSGVFWIFIVIKHENAIINFALSPASWKQIDSRFWSLSDLFAKRSHIYQLLVKIISRESLRVTAANWFFEKKHSERKKFNSQEKNGKFDMRNNELYKWNNDRLEKSIKTSEE